MVSCCDIYSAFSPPMSRRSLMKDWNRYKRKTNTANKVPYIAEQFPNLAIHANQNILCRFQMPIQSCSMLGGSSAVERASPEAYLQSIVSAPVNFRLRVHVDVSFLFLSWTGGSTERSDLRITKCFLECAELPLQNVSRCATTP